MLEHLEATGKSNATTVHKHESITTIRGTGWKAKFTVQMTILKCSHTFKLMRLGVFLFCFFFSQKEKYDITGIRCLSSIAIRTRTCQSDVSVGRVTPNVSL